MSRVVEHEYYYPGGPVTTEYFFPIQGWESWLEAQQPVDPTLNGIASETELFSWWQERKSEVSHGMSRSIVTHLQDCAPTSLCVYSGFAWLAFRKNVSDYENAVLVPVISPMPTRPAEVGYLLPDEFVEFLDNFRTISTCIPPSLVPWSQRGFKVIDDTEQVSYCLPTAWRNSIATLPLDNGDVVLARSDGAIGVWYHESVADGVATIDPVSRESLEEKLHEWLSIR